MKNIKMEIDGNINLIIITFILVLYNKTLKQIEFVADDR